MKVLMTVTNSVMRLPSRLWAPSPHWHSGVREILECQSESIHANTRRKSHDNQLIKLSPCWF